MFSKESEHIIVEEGVTRIDNLTFFNFKKLKSVTLPDSIVEIEDCAFEYCRNLKDINFPSGLRKVGDRVFNHCEGLNGWRTGACRILEQKYTYEDVFVNRSIIPEVCAFDKLPFQFTPQSQHSSPISLEYQEHTIEFEMKDDNLFLAYDKKISLLMRYTDIEDFTFDISPKDYYILKLRCLNFDQCEKGIVLQISYLVEHKYEPPFDDSRSCLIGISIFKRSLIIRENGEIEECNIKLKEEVSYSQDGKRLLYVPEDIEYFQIPNNVTCIGKMAFANCNKLVKVELTEGLEEIEELAFCNCKSLQSIIIPKTVLYISDNAFVLCNNIKSFICLGPTWFTSVYNLFKSSHDLLEEIRIPECKISLESYAFTEFPKLKYVTLPKHLKNINMNMFYSCDKLICLELPDEITSITNFADINYTPWVQNLTEPIIMGNILLRYVGKDNFYRVPDYIEYIAKEAFANCECLHCVSIPNSVRRIEERAFSKCKNLKSVVLPENNELFISPSAFERTPWAEERS